MSKDLNDVHPQDLRKMKRTSYHQFNLKQGGFVTKVVWPARWRDTGKLSTPFLSPPYDDSVLQRNFLRFQLLASLSTNGISTSGSISAFERISINIIAHVSHSSRRSHDNFLPTLILERDFIDQQRSRSLFSLSYILIPPIHNSHRRLSPQNELPPHNEGVLLTSGGLQ